MRSIFAVLIMGFFSACATTTSSTATVPGCMPIDSRSDSLLQKAVSGDDPIDGLYCGTWEGGSPTYIIVKEDGEDLEYFYKVDMRGTISVHSAGHAEWEEVGKRFSFNARGARVYVTVQGNELHANISTTGGYSSAVLRKINDVTFASAE